MYKAEILKDKIQKDKGGHPWSVSPPTTWGVVNNKGYAVAYIPNHIGEPMAHLIAKLLNQNTKYKLKNE